MFERSTSIIGLSWHQVSFPVSPHLSASIAISHAKIPADKLRQPAVLPSTSTTQHPIIIAMFAISKSIATLTRADHLRKIPPYLLVPNAYVALYLYLSDLLSYVSLVVLSMRYGTLWGYFLISMSGVWVALEVESQSSHAIDVFFPFANFHSRTISSSPVSRLFFWLYLFSLFFCSFLILSFFLVRFLFSISFKRAGCLLDLLGHQRDEEVAVDEAPQHGACL
jgi:hypothetical protein